MQHLTDVGGTNILDGSSIDARVVVMEVELQNVPNADISYSIILLFGRFVVELQLISKLNISQEYFLFVRSIN